MIKNLGIDMHEYMHVCIARDSFMRAEADDQCENVEHKNDYKNKIGEQVMTSQTHMHIKILFDCTVDRKKHTRTHTHVQTCTCTASLSTLNKGTKALVKLFQPDGQVTKTRSVGRSKSPAPSHQGKSEKWNSSQTQMTSYIHHCQTTSENNNCLATVCFSYSLFQPQ